jgi:hypothetical protein
MLNYSALQKNLNIGVFPQNGIFPINKLFNLSESQIDNIKDGDKFLYVESTNSPLQQIPVDQVRANCINPLTGKQYNGIYLSGIFADLESYPNNNNRIYSIPEYLDLLHILKNQVHSHKGVYGELEHPANSRYSINYNMVSHKILDLWYDPKTMKVYGTIVLMKTPKGRIAREIIETGGLLATSARAAGETQKMPDGTIYCVIKLLTTYDCVYHPGFVKALFDVNKDLTGNLNESQNGFSGILFENDLNKINKSYSQYINSVERESFRNLNESIKEKPKHCFYEWYFSNRIANLNEGQLIIDDKKKTKNPIDSDSDNLENLNQISPEDKDRYEPSTTGEQKLKNQIDTNKDKNLDSVQQQKLETNKSNDQNKIENDLEKSVDQDLKEHLNESKVTFFNQGTNSTKKLFNQLNEDIDSQIADIRKKKRQKRLIANEAKSYYDNSAGFVTSGIGGTGSGLHGTSESDISEEEED